MEQALLIAGFLLALVGLAGAILPMLPGTPLVLAGLVLAAWADGFAHVGWPTLMMLSVLTAAAYGAELLATTLGAKRAGASRLGLAGALIGTFAGMFFGLAGLIAGPFLGAVAGEYLARRDLYHAGNVGLGSWLGLVVGGAAKLALAFTMVGVFILGWFL